MWSLRQGHRGVAQRAASPTLRVVPREADASEPVVLLARQGDTWRGMAGDAHERASQQASRSLAPKSEFFTHRSAVDRSKRRSRGHSRVPTTTASNFGFVSMKAASNRSHNLQKDCGWMVIVGPSLDVNTILQMIARLHRPGQ